MRERVVVQVVRGARIDSVHEIAAVAVDRDGAVIGVTAPGDDGGAGDQFSAYMRSSAKPFQAAVAVRFGVLDALGLSDRHLAVACGSHNAGDAHISAVLDVLAAAGLDPSALQCGDDGAGSPLRHQCSGNHALALATCAVAGWPTDTYLSAEHPLQQAYLDEMNTVVDGGVTTGPDGCGMTAYRAPLAKVASAFAKLATTDEPGLSRCRNAMAIYPYLVRWPGEIDAELMRAHEGVVAKIGAEGILGVGTADGRALVIRVVDGALRAVAPAAVYLAQRWLSLDPQPDSTAPLARPPLLDNRGGVVGELRVFSPSG